MPPQDTELRLLLTNDIFGSFFPQTTSYGCIAGGAALVQTIDRLREGAGACAWIDGGDFSGGGPLAPVDVRQAWRAADALGIDAAVPGNHEFDFGDELLKELSGEASIPLVAADLAGVRDDVVVAAPGGRTVAVVGLCLPERRGQRVYHVDPDLETAGRRARERAHELRGEVDHVVVVIHDGVRWGPPALAGPAAADPRMSLLCSLLRGCVDAVVGGHTLGRHVGTLAGVPFVQPWALASEVGVLDFGPDGVTARGVWVDGPPGWDGPGADTEAELRSQVVGELREPLVTQFRGLTTLGDTLGQGLLRLLEADIALVSQTEVGCVQLAIDGIAAYLPAGPVTEADVQRVLPWPAGPLGDEVWVADLEPHELDTAAKVLTEGIGAPSTVPRQEGIRGGATLVSSSYLPRIRAAIDRDVAWELPGIGQRDGLRAAIEQGGLT
jgi:2',3'-cyclic-nucleotide 2'-phosphodiesterase (5'-nucleotidase family)